MRRSPSFSRFYPHHYLALWIGVAIVIGPVVRLCASWMRSMRPILEAIFQLYDLLPLVRHNVVP